MSVDVLGDKDFLKDLETMQKEYKDVSIDAISAVGNRFKSKLRKTVRSKVKSDDNCKKLTSGFRTWKIGTGMAASVAFSAESGKNPQWHLVENGHEMYAPNTKHVYNLPNGYKTLGVNPHAHVGYVRGIKAVDETLSGFEDDFEKVVNHTMNRYLKKYGGD